jgi:hypothetical protein
MSLKELVAARTQRRRALQQQLAERTALVETLLAVRRAEVVADLAAPIPPPTPATPRLKRYIHE